MQCRISTTDKSPHQPLPHTNTLASLVKGEVLSPEKIRATTGGIASPPSLRTTFLPPLVKGEVLSPKNSGDYRRDCHTYRTLSVSLTPPLTISHSAPNSPKTALSLENHQHPCLPSKKGRWLDGKAQAFILLLSACATSAFFIHQTFLPSRRRDCYIPSPHTNPSKNRTIPSPCTISLPPLEKGEVA